MRALTTATVLIPTALVMALAGCAKTKPAAVATLSEYSSALDKGDYGKAYDMMSEEFRETHSKEEFVRMMKQNTAEVRETASRLDGAHRDVEVTARFRYGKGDELRLVFEDGEWKIANNPVAFYGQSTPRDALRSFLRAYRLERWDVMLKLIPAQYAEKMDVAKVKVQFHGPRRDEIDLMMHRLEEQVDGTIIEKGTEARLTYGDDEVTFVREDGLWKIKDPD